MSQQFAWSSRVLHWLMAAMILTMLFVGAAMVSSLDHYHRLLSIHRPLGIAILVFVIVRFVNRQLMRMPPFPPTMPQAERAIASASELLLYTLMFLQPLVGWAMLSAARYPVMLFGSLHLPPILPVNQSLFVVLRTTHTILAYLLFFTFTAHLAGVLLHTLVLRDRLLWRMLPFRDRKNRSPAPRSS
jgi:cytochrome b561